jgi:thiosulfate reductase cytochrome b subunit
MGKGTMLLHGTRAPAETRRYRRIKAQCRVVRAARWINVIAILFMIGSGWRICNNVPIFSWLTFPESAMREAILNYL